MIAAIIAAWVTTLPVAGVIAYLLFGVLRVL